MGLILQNQLERALVKTKDYIDKKIEEIPESGYSDANVKAVDIGEEIEDVNIEYVTKDELQDAVESINPAPMVSVTYSELVELRNNGGLIAGMQYRITDYVTTTAQENTRSAGHQFDVIVTADSANKLNEVARAGFPTFNIERYRLVFSPSWTEAMNYIGLYEHNGRTYYQYQSASEDMQMLVAFSEEINMTNVTDDPMGQRFMWVIYPSYGRKYENDVWGEWKSGESLGESIAFETNPNSAYFHDAGAKLEAWKIWYCLDNDAERFAWADAENGKGVIYRMIDEWNNDLPYDFKNIMFKRYELNAPELYEASGIDYWIQKLSENIRAMFNSECQAFIWSGLYEQDKYWENDYEAVMSTPTGRSRFFYTFSDDSDISFDSSLGGACGNNVMLSSYRLPNNVFFGGGEHYGNRFGSNCYDNSFSSDCLENTFGSDCCENCFGVSCYYNTFGNSCSYNSFGFNCQYNNFGNQFNYNSLGDGCHNNSFENGSKYNGLGMYCTYNTFGNVCAYNTLGDNCTYNSFGDECQSISFKDIDGFANFSRCKFDSGVHSFEIYHDVTHHEYSTHRCIHVYSGVTGWVEIIDADRNYETCYALDKNGKVHEFCIMDFKNS